MTSHDVVNRVRRALGLRRVGHTGTLDPAATGVLVLLVGKATKLAPFLEDLDKTYRAVGTFGVTTDSQDSTGQVLRRKKVSLGVEELEGALEQWQGRITQLPPMTSAVRVQGKRLHRLAREGKEVERPERTVHIFRLRLLHLEQDEAPGNPRVLLECHCSKGTYVRTLLSDLGDYMGCGAHLSFLLRTAVGPFSVQDAVTLEELENSSRPWEWVKPAFAALPHLPRVVLSHDQLSRVRSGNTVILEQGQLGARSIGTDTWVAVDSGDGTLVAVARAQETRGKVELRPQKVL